jgi:drug/metabolite transporter (DMT)-like permease
VIFNKKIVIGAILTAIGVFFLARSYHPAFSGIGYTGAHFEPALLSTGILMLIFGGILLAKGIKEYLVK